MAYTSTNAHAGHVFEQQAPIHTYLYAKPSEFPYAAHTFNFGKAEQTIAPFLFAARERVVSVFTTSAMTTST